MTKKMKRLSLAALVLCSVFLISLSLTGCGSSDDQSETGGTAADSGIFKSMEAKDLEGNTLDNEIFKNNKLTLVNVWNLGCTPCIQEIPHLDEIQEAYKDKGVAVYGLYYNFGNKISDSERADIDSLLKQAKASYPQIEPSEEMYSSDEIQQLTAFPTTFFVDSEGNIVKTEEGAKDFDGWKALIDKVLEEVEADA